MQSSCRFGLLWRLSARPRKFEIARRVGEDRFMRFFLASIMTAFTAASVAAQDAGIEFFEKKIRPVLVEHCHECHAAGAKKFRGGLLVDSRPALQKGGETGPALVPGHPEKSLLIKAIGYRDDDLKMPPKGKLPAAVIADLEAWIAMGAPDPRDKVTAIPQAASWSDVAAQRKNWWSLQPPSRPKIPSGDERLSPIDRFVFAQLVKKNLSLTAPAPAHTLLRRLSLVLTGLPPTPAELADFERRAAQTSLSTAAREATDRLLDSPHFGERWARHWMDVVRFSETHGNEWNYEVHHAWRYRDYLIRAFNADVPYDQLIREHIAGDLLPAPRMNAKERFNESIIGAAFWRFGEVNHDDCISLRQIGYDLADNQIDTLTKGFQAMTVACARCHDHKLDAVSMRDYYGLLSIVRSSRCVSHTIDAADVNADILADMRAKTNILRHELAARWLEDAASERMEKWLAERAGDKLVDDDPLAIWMRIANLQKSKSLAFREAFDAVKEGVKRDEVARRQAYADDYRAIADFRGDDRPWQAGGQGLRDPRSRAGDLSIGDGAIAGILPAGCFTHRSSQTLNGTLRSPVLTSAFTANKKRISFRVVGEHTSAVRLVSNNCQLNYQNYRALASDRWQWITFLLPDDRDSLNSA
jgi:mono/diheme cytochrome c family protein